MTIFDFNIHLPLQKHIQNNDVNEVIHEDLHLNFRDLRTSFQKNLSKLQQCTGGNFMLFNTKLFDEEIKNFSDFNNLVKSELKYASFTALIDFRRKDVFNYLEKVVNNIDFIMFNSYLQQISEEDFESVYKVCSFAEKNKIKICIDASYGTSKMYTYDNLKLACYITDRITRIPVVIIHCGGKRILDAMLLAADKSNIYLDTSFSLPYYINSSVEMDMAFAFKNIGTHRVLYGSDFPYLNSDKAKEIHLDFFDKYHFSSEDVENIMFNNAVRLIQDE
jgi:predicted TIM-barrel fold metal-dependent hydrolase